MNNLGMVYMRQNKVAEAASLYLRALDIEKELIGVEHSDYAKTVLNLGRLYRDTGDYLKGDSALHVALKIAETVMGKESALYGTCNYELALSYFQNNNLAHAEPIFQEVNQNLLNQINKFFPSFSEFEKEAFYKTIRSQFEVFNSLGIQYHAQHPSIVADMYDNQLATKALLYHATNQIRNRILNSHDSIAIRLFTDLKTKKEYLSSVYALPIATKHQANVNVKVLEEEANTLEKQLSERSELFAQLNDTKKYTWMDVKSKLKAGEAAIEIIRFHKFDPRSRKPNHTEKIFTQEQPIQSTMRL